MHDTIEWEWCHIFADHADNMDKHVGIIPVIRLIKEAPPQAEVGRALPYQMVYPLTEFTEFVRNCPQSEECSSAHYPVNH